MSQSETSDSSRLTLFFLLQMDKREGVLEISSPVGVYQEKRFLFLHKPYEEAGI